MVQFVGYRLEGPGDWRGEIAPMLVQTFDSEGAAYGWVFGPGSGDPLRWVYARNGDEPGQWQDLVHKPVPIPEPEPSVSADQPSTINEYEPAEEMPPPGAVDLRGEIRGRIVGLQRMGPDDEWLAVTLALVPSQGGRRRLVLLDADLVKNEHGTLSLGEIFVIAAPPEPEPEQS